MIVAERRTSRAEPAQAPLHRFTVEQYHDMIQAGILTPLDRVELLDGWIVDKMSRNPPHAATLTRINRHLIRILPDDWLLRVQDPITLETSEPEPDFAIARGPDERYLKRHPGPRDLPLVIEVADSTLLNDRLHKLELYARARIPAYWIVNLVHGIVQCHEQPRAGKSPTYRRQKDYAKGQRVPLILAGTSIADIAVDELLP